MINKLAKNNLKYHIRVSQLIFSFGLKKLLLIGLHMVFALQQTAIFQQEKPLDIVSNGLFISPALLV
jgi:hypothetical protein